MKYIITGINGGLGKYLYESIDGSLGIHRHNLNEVISSINSDDVIIHCAFNKQNVINNYFEYLNDNIFLTKTLFELGNRMVYISSIDVYLQNNTYSLFKKFSESIVSQYDKNLILRCPALVGEYMKHNHLFKIKNNDDIGLSADSTFNYILYEDVLNVVKSNFVGTYDIVSNSNIDLNSVSDFFNSKTTFGSYKYTTPTTFKNPINLNKTSIQTLKNYFK